MPNPKLPLPLDFLAANFLVANFLAANNSLQPLQQQQASGQDMTVHGCWHLDSTALAAVVHLRPEGGLH